MPKGAGFRRAPLHLVQRDGAKVFAPPEFQRRRTDTGFSRAVKLTVRKRAGNGDLDEACCEACGRWLGRHQGEVQHRASRGSGGCKDQVINGPANAVLLCGHGAAPIRSGCHGSCEDRDEHMGMGAGGFWIKHGTTPEYDPRNVPIKPHGSGKPAWLTEAGGYRYEEPDGSAA